MIPIISLAVALALAADSTRVVRVNQVGYLPDAPKAAVLCTLDSARVSTFVVRDTAGRVVFGPRPAAAAGSFGPCVGTYRLDFTPLRRAGRFVIEAGGVKSPVIRIGNDVFAGGADTLLGYMRQQRSGYNPFFRDSVHRLDGYVVDDT